MLRILANAAPITGGAAGILIKLDVRPENFQFASRAVFFWIALALVGAVLILNRMIEQRRFGAYLVAIRENEAAARALGVNVLAVKLQAISLSAAITAAAGALYAQYFLYLDAASPSAWISVEALLAAIIGGAGTVLGPLLGAGFCMASARSPSSRRGACRASISWSMASCSFSWWPSRRAG